jgi:drug/metabolite transporter (DMT)-like permease
MWLLLAFLSAALLGFYDVFKKHALKDNAVIPVLCFNTLFCSLFFLPLILVSAFRPEWLQDSQWFIPVSGWEVHKYILLKAVIVLASWVLGYFGMKHLPITLVGPINATRPVMVLVGAMLVFGERLNLYQWIGVALAVCSFFLLSRSGKKEGIRFTHDKWVYCVVGAAMLGAVSGLYDKHLMAPVSTGGLGLDRMTVQSWYNCYQFLMMTVMLLLLWWPRRQSSPFQWKWSIVCISLFLTAADLAYFHALSLEGAMISIVSMVRRGSVVVSFLFGAVVFREKNLRSKAVDLVWVLMGMLFLYLGTR